MKLKVTKMGKDLAAPQGAMCICESRQGIVIIAMEGTQFSPRRRSRGGGKASDHPSGMVYFSGTNVDAGVTQLGVRASSVIH